MPHHALTILAAVLLLAIPACAKRVEVTHPPIDASATRLADALVVTSDYAEGVRAPGGVIRGAGQGAAYAAVGYLGAVATAGGDGAVVGLLLAPVAMPIAAIIGATQAHSAEEVDAAREAFNRLGQDTAFMRGLEARVLNELKTRRAGQWDCMAAATEAEGTPCPDASLVATLTLRPRFAVVPEGKYSPDIHVAIEVMVSASLDSTGADGGRERVFEAKWAYRAEVGGYFELAANDAAGMRARLGEIMDRIAARIVRDAYTAPGPEMVVRVTPPNGRTFVEVPANTVLRTEQGLNLVSPATHAVIFPHGSSAIERCWFTAINGKPTGQTRETMMMQRRIEVPAGEVGVELMCEQNHGSINEVVSERSLSFEVRAGKIYRTDGRTFARVDG